MDADIPPTELMAQDPTAGPPIARSRARTNSLAAPENSQDAAEIQNERAVQVLNRVKDKLTGHDFKKEEELSYINQVDKLLIEATKFENLCQHYIGWCSFW
jgi:serine/threonine-protein kinase mTOR